MGPQGFPPGLEGDPQRTANAPRHWPLLSYIVLAIAVATTLAAGAFWLGSRPNPSPIEILLPTPTPVAPVMAHVVGQVRSPGLYSLPHGARVEDAIRAAGGVSDGGDADAINRAAPLRDGERIVVPRRSDGPLAARQEDGSGRGLDDPLLEREEDTRAFSAIAALATQQAGVQADQQAGTRTDVIDLNTADLTALMSLPGIGQVRAEAIIRWREANGPIQSVDDLTSISGIGSGTVSAIRPLVAPQ